VFLRVLGTALTWDLIERGDRVSLSCRFVHW
jgi:hypothetical protein